MVGHDRSRPHRRVAGDASDPHRGHGGGADDAEEVRGGRPIAHRDGVPDRLVDLGQRARSEHDLTRPVKAVAAQDRWRDSRTG